MTETVPGKTREAAPNFKKARELAEGDIIMLPADYIRQMMDESKWGDDSKRFEVDFILRKEGGYPAVLVGCDGVVQRKQVVDGKEETIPYVFIQTWPISKTFPASEWVDYLCSIPELGYTKGSKDDEWDILRHFVDDKKAALPTELNYRQLISLWKFSQLDPDQSFEVLGKTLDWQKD